MLKITPWRRHQQIFDRLTKKLQRNRTARNVEQSRQVDYLREEIAQRLVDRLQVKPPFLLFDPWSRKRNNSGEGIRISSEHFP